MVDRLAEFINRARRFINPRAGLIRQVFELSTEPDDARIHFAATGVAVTSRYGLRVNCSNHNGGAGLTREAALAAALGETIERYACSVFFLRELRFCSYGELPGRAIHPDALTVYSPLQYAQTDFPFRPFTAATPMRWARGVSLSDGEPIWYPACLTYVPYIPGPEEVCVAPSVSTGMALAMTPEEAILSGLCEVVERDAIMCMWWNRLPAPEIVVPRDSWLGERMADHFTVPGVTFRLFDITTDTGIPTVFCVVMEDRDNGCAIACGAAARPDPAQAALKALIEAAQTRAWVRSLTRKHGVSEIAEGFKDITSFEDHIRLYARPDMRHAVGFLTEHGRTVHLQALSRMETGEAGSSIQACVAALKRAGLEPIAVDVTPADVAEQGLWAVKVAVPGMVDLNGDHNLRCLGVRRLYEVPVRMGYRTRAAAESELNPFPHPFP